MNWSDKTVEMLANYFEGYKQLSKHYCEIYAKSSLAAVEQTKEWKDRFDCERKEINVYGTEAKYLSDEIDRLKADHATFRKVANDRADYLKRQLEQAIDLLDWQRNKPLYPMDEQVKTSKQVKDFIERHRNEK